MAKRRGDFIEARLANQPGAWWPKTVLKRFGPVVRGYYKKTVRFWSGAVMAQIELKDGGHVWIPDSPKCTEFYVLSTRG